MGETTTCRPAMPSPAERARTIAARVGNSALVPSSSAERISPLLHHVHPDGAATLLLADDHPLIDSTLQGAAGEIPATLEVADRTPVALREPVRGLLWITGWLRVPDPRSARVEALMVAEQRPDSRLLDVGHGATVLRLESVSLVIADAAGSFPVGVDAFNAASPDPFCHLEDAWLRHLELSHRDVVSKLVRHLPEELRGGHVRPLGLDRFGLRLRVESADGDHDVRLAFSGPVADEQRLSSELRRLVGCPFLSEQAPQRDKRS